MTLTSIVSVVEGREKTLTVFDPRERAVVEELQAVLASAPVSVETASSDDGPNDFLVLTEGDSVVTAFDLDGVGVDDVDDLVTAEILQYIEDTTFTSFDTRQMVATSREIEDRAWRSGVGTLHAGFQHTSAYVRQSDIYRDLARKRLDIHVYATGDRTVDTPDGVTLHLSDDDEIARTWFVAYDGGDDPTDKCALLAEERDAGEFYGVWTYDGTTVDEITDYLEGAYCVPA